jgi:hypothetical protein
VEVEVVQLVISLATEISSMRFQYCFLVSFNHTITIDFESLPEDGIVGCGVDAKHITLEPVLYVPSFAPDYPSSIIFIFPRIVATAQNSSSPNFCPLNVIQVTKLDM